jgi:predicted phosphodiesterase
VKLALLGDIHGNHLALRVVLDAASSAGAECLLVTGDLVGYYYAPLEVLKMLQAWDRHVVRGNHEDMLNSVRSDPELLLQIDRRYGNGLRVAIEQLDTQQLDELCNLPHPLELEIDGCRMLLCHGAPWDVDQYVYPDAESGVAGTLCQAGSGSCRDGAYPLPDAICDRRNADYQSRLRRAAA